MKIYGAFAVPFGLSEIGKIPESEHNELLNLPYYLKQDYQMVVSQNSRVLDTMAPTIKSFIIEQLNLYTQQTLGTYKKLKITQSWCTKHDKIKQQIHQHRHQNSIVSGSYYVNADSSNQGIKFFKDDDYMDKYITWETSDDLMKKHEWNWKWINFPVQTGMLVLFPSYMRHCVDGAFSDNLRCSLAFNTWFEEPIGIEHDFTKNL